MEIVGQTNDGKDVLAGLYQLYATHGLPLDIIIGGVLDRGAMPCWISLLKEGIAEGIKRDKWINQISSAIADTGNKELSVYVSEVLHKMPL